MSKINRYVLASTEDNVAADRDTIAMNLVAGERVFIEPVGEVYLIIDGEGVPQVEFVLANNLIEEVFTHQIVKLQNQRINLKTAEG